MNGEPDPQEMARWEDELRDTFEGKQVDYVPDPMVLRTAELFLLGRQGCMAQQGGHSEGEIWAVIEKNIDGLLAFFHVLMTRDRVPLIDYGYTFPGGALMDQLGELAVDVHPQWDLYQALAEDGFRKVEQMDLDAVDPMIAADVVDELGTARYEWFPAENRFENLIRGDDRSRQVLATFILGGIIFGGYAQATSSDHLLQTKRARLFAELTVPQDEGVLWGFAQEHRLYERLRTMAEASEGLSHADFTLPPSVLPLLIATDAPLTPQALFDKAMGLRSSPLGQAYRQWHSGLREAWSQGRRDTGAEAAASDVAKEVERRFGLADGALSGPRLKLSGGVGVHLGIVQLGAAAEHEIQIAAPGQLRNWIVDRLRFRGHRKMLLRMSLEQAKFDNLALGLRNIWRRSNYRADPR
jgi:hypothetical protein